MKVDVIDMGGNGIPMTEIWAWIVVHGPGDESIDTWTGCRRRTCP